MTNEGMILWLLLDAIFVVPLILRFVLISKYRTPRWKANLAAIGFIPSLGLLGSALMIGSMSEQDIAMAMIFPLYLVSIPFIAAIVAVIVAELVEAVS